jgi:hypothetical protein
MARRADGGDLGVVAVVLVAGIAVLLGRYLRLCEEGGVLLLVRQAGHYEVGRHGWLIFSLFFGDLSMASITGAPDLAGRKGTTMRRDEADSGGQEQPRRVGGKIKEQGRGEEQRLDRLVPGR